LIHLQDGDSRLSLDPVVGNIPAWRAGARQPLHCAPWRDEPAVQDDPAIAMVNKRLAGDFFCMPFGRDDVAGDPPHGHTANSAWDVLSQDAGAAHLRLSVPVRGAQIDKHVVISGAALYQTHRISGGAGRVSFAHHPMARMAKGGRLSFSPKRAALTDPAPQYAGHGLWALNQARTALWLACDDGRDWDLRHYPARHRVEDFCLLVEAPGATLGWTVLMRDAEDDMLVVLKDARTMPVTMIWVSNGGRDFSPWNGRHTGVIGIEDGCAAGGSGLADALGDNRITAMGVPTAIDLSQPHVIRHAMLSLPRPRGWTEVCDITLADGGVTLTEIGGATVTAAFDDGFFA
jgi:hypothetical protein